MTSVATNSAVRKHARVEAEREWLVFPDLPGTHLSWRKIGWGKWELVAQNERVWVTMTHRIFKPSSIADTSLTYEERPMQPPKEGSHQWVDARGESICTVTGSHWDRNEGCSMTFGTLGTLSFPVKGKWNRAVMSAINEEGDVPIRYRLNPIAGNLPIGNPPFSCNLKRVEAVVAPGAATLPHLVLLIASSCPLLLAYFQHSGGG